MTLTPSGGPWDAGGTIRRRRSCRNCGAVHNTMEMVMSHNSMTACDFMVATPTGLLMRIDDLDITGVLRLALKRMTEENI